TLLISLPSPNHQHPVGQSSSVSTHLCLRHDPRRDEPASAHAVDGSLRYPDYVALCAGHLTRRLPSVCTRRGAAYSSPSEDIMKGRRPSLQHPLAPLFARAIDSFSAALKPESIRHSHGTARNFLSYLGANHPEVHRLNQLRREPHILGWMSSLRSQVPPLVTASYLGRLVALRPILNELAWSEQLPELAHLIRRGIFRVARNNFHAHLHPSRTNSCSRNSSAAMISVAMSFC